MREDANFLLATILLGNVGINVLLTLLSNQILAGIAAFLFSTVFITTFGEIMPQAHYALDADNFLREGLFARKPLNPLHFCHKPIVITNPETPFEEVILRLKVVPQRTGDDVIDEDLILLWVESKKIITGADILGRLLRGIVKGEHPKR